MHTRYLAIVLSGLVAVLGTAGLVETAQAGRRAAASSRAEPLSQEKVQAAVKDYINARGYRPGRVRVKVKGLTKSGKSTRISIRIPGGNYFLWRKYEIAAVVQNDTLKVTPQDAVVLTNILGEANRVPKRAETGAGSRFAVTEIGYGASSTGAPLGRPRKGQTQAQLAHDVRSLGRNGSIRLILGSAVIAGEEGARVIVTEGGVPDNDGNIRNQTPAKVYAEYNGKLHYLGTAGHKAAGDVLYLANAQPPIPAGAPVTRIRVVDSPDLQNPVDPTDNAVAQARGVRGFDLVSVEGRRGKKAGK